MYSHLHSALKKWPSSNISRLFLNQNYYFMKRLAYTEDQVLVQKLFLYRVPAGLSPQRVLQYLNSYGSVLRFKLFQPPIKRNGNKSKLKTGYVIFADPLSAAKALRRGEHFVDNHRFFLKPNFSWSQPDAAGSPDIEIDESSESILNLNDNCLDYIMRMCSIHDRIRLARTCTRFLAIYEQVSPILDKAIHLDIFNNMTLWEVMDFFRVSGHNIKELTGFNHKHQNSTLLDFISKRCINLISLEINTVQFPMAKFYKLICNKNQLQNLCLRRCHLDDYLLPALQNLPQLKKLDISSNNKLTGDNMDKLPASIEWLSIGFCTKIKPNLLLNICKSLPNLKELIIIGNDDLSFALAQETNVNCCESLETLHMNCQTVPKGHFKYIAELPNLKILDLHNFENETWVPSDVLPMLVKYKSKQLQQFEIRGKSVINNYALLQLGKLTALNTLCLANNSEITDLGIGKLEALQNLETINLRGCVNVTNEAVLGLIISCSKLKELHLQDCVRLTNNLVFNILKMWQTLRIKESNRLLPIKLYMCVCQIDRYTMQYPEVADEKIVKVSVMYCKSPDSDRYDFHEYYSYMDESWSLSSLSDWDTNVDDDYDPSDFDDSFDD